MRHFLRLIAWAGGAALAFWALDVVLNAYRFAVVPKNLSVVRANVLYRSGQLRPHHLQKAIEQHGIRTIVCLNPGESPEERDIATRMGVKHIEFAMPGSGQGQPAYFHKYLEILADPENRPVLVHCNAGAYRTGASVALYRMVFEGWLLDDAVREMKYSGFAGQQDLIDHVRMTFDSIPPGIVSRVYQRMADRLAAQPETGRNVE